MRVLCYKCEKLVEEKEPIKVTCCVSWCLCKECKEKQEKEEQ